MAGSAEWVAGSAVKLVIFSDFWRGATRPRHKSKKMLKKIWRNFGGNSRNFGGMGGCLGRMGGWLCHKTWHFFRFLAQRRAPTPKIELFPSVDPKNSFECDNKVLCYWVFVIPCFCDISDSGDSLRSSRSAHVQICVLCFMCCFICCYVLCFIFHILCFMFYVLCVTFHVLCFVHVLCFIFHVLCFVMFYVLCFDRHNTKHET